MSMMSISYNSTEKYYFSVKLKESKDEYRILLTLSNYTPIFIANNVVVASQWYYKCIISKMTVGKKYRN